MTMATQKIAPTSREPHSIDSNLLRGFRFRVSEDPESARQAYDVRRRVYVEGSGYDLAVPDEYDQRCWLLVAEDLTTNQVVGTMRLTPRDAGPLEVEEYFTLPRQLRSPRTVELNRFAILPSYRKGSTFLPVVSFGIFKLVYDFLKIVGAHYMVIASKPERIWTYQWLMFERTGLVGKYGSLAGAEHELLWCPYRHYDVITQGHPVHEFFVESSYREVIVPARCPRLGAGGPRSLEGFPIAVGG